MSGRQSPTSDLVVCVYPHQPRHSHGASAAVCVGARAPVAVGVAIAVVIAAGFKKQIEASEIGDPRSERLTRCRGGIGVLVDDSPVRCAGGMSMGLHGESRASKLRAWQTATAGCVVESILAHHNGLSP